MILDLRDFRKLYGVECADIARRLMDYGFHAPTLSFPVHETLMIEPTESESLAELDRFVESLVAIKRECEPDTRRRSPTPRTIRSRWLPIRRRRLAPIHGLTLMAESGPCSRYRGFGPTSFSLT